MVWKGMHASKKIYNLLEYSLMFLILSDYILQTFVEECWYNKKASKWKGKKKVTKVK